MLWSFSKYTQHTWAAMLSNASINEHNLRPGNGKVYSETVRSLESNQVFSLSYAVPYNNTKPNDFALFSS